MNTYQSLTGNWEKNDIVNFHDKKWLVLRKGKKNSTLFCLDNFGLYDHVQADWIAAHFGDELNGIIFPKDKPDMSDWKELKIKREKPKYDGLSFISRLPSVNDLTGRLYPVLINEVSGNLITGKDYWLSNNCGYIEDNEYHFISDVGERSYCPGSDIKTVSPLLIISSSHV